jgi:hypothetical protein
VLEHEEAVGDWFEEAEERGLTRNDVSTVAAPYRRGLVDGGSVPWSARLTPRPENIVELGACSGRRRQGRRRTRAARPLWSARQGRRRWPLGRRGSTATARTHVEEVGGVVGEMRGTGAELVEVEARAEPRRAVTYAGGIGGWRCARTERAEAGSRASRGEIGLASTTAHGRQWIGTASARGQRRAEHGVERMGVGGRWHGSMAAHGERGDEVMARAFKRWVRLTRGPSSLLI